MPFSKSNPMTHSRMWLTLCVFATSFYANAQTQNPEVASTNTPAIAANAPAAGRDTIPAQVAVPTSDQRLQVFMPFRTMPQHDVTAAVSVLRPENYIDRDFNLSVEGGINGRVGGLIGTSSIWGMDNALVMIDGVRREFSDITLTEVQQITVLKGVNAVALYGSQAARGVILITSKSGEANVRKVSVRVNSGIAMPTELPKYLNSADYMTLYNEGRRNDGLADLYSAATIEGFRSGNQYRHPSVDYFSSTYLKKYQTATNANAEFSGGNASARFYSNVGWATNSSLLKLGEGNNEADNRLSIRGNVDLKLNDKISSSVYVSAIFNDSRRARGNFWGRADSILPNRITPLIPINLITPGDKNSLALVDASRNVIDGQYLLGGTQQVLTNPTGDLYVGGYDKNIRRTFQVTNKIDANLSSVVPGLSFHTLFNLDYSNSYLQSITNTYAVYLPTWTATGDTLKSLQKFGDDTRPGIQNINNTAQRQNIGFSAWLAYEKSINDKHNFSAMLLGYTSSISTNDVYQPTTNSHLGLQVGYNFKHKFIADVTTLYVNSTKLPTGNRTGFSPTASVGWVLTSEPFLERSKSVNFLKLSVGGGILKSDVDINGYYLYDDVYQRGAFFTWNDGIQAQNQASTPQFGASPNLTFPERREVNVSLEGTFFQKVLSLQASFFRSEMSGLPTQRFSQYPTYYSAFIPYTNYNAQQRTGVDLALNLTKKFGEVEFNLGAAGTYANSKVTKRDELYFDQYQNRQGRPVDAIYGLVSDGFFADQNDINTRPKQAFSTVVPGDIRYKDQNGDGVIDTRDEVKIGRYSSPLNYGINLSASFRNFSLFVLATGSQGGYGLKNNPYYWVSGDLKYSEVVLNRWTPATAATATFPRLSSQSNANDFRVSDFWLYKTDRLNLSKVQLTYNFSGKALRSKFVQNVLIYVSGSNLVTAAPNRQILELNINSAPQLRSYIAGIKASF
jgi:TonB-linked SusC/RagA family outer membrane protein